MSLKTYRSKRHFKETPEPRGTKGKGGKQLRFCVQKHAARSLHYDFRLEHRGVLLSWAVPKGPSLNPKDKRLAIHVEDHPLSYQSFEGVIPKGHYGAGTVEIWDKGTYTFVGETDRKASEKQISAGLKKGHLAIVLTGKRLKGEFILQKLKIDEPEDKAWLLIKKKDTPLSPKTKTKSTPRKGKKSKMPSFFSPMLAKLIDKPFTHPDWIFEVKWDGFRALAFIQQGKALLKSRSGLDFSARFKPVIEQLKKIPIDVILDGELVILDEKGRSHFQLMQNYQRTQQGKLAYYVFDLLFKEGEDLRSLPLLERKETLKKLLKPLRLSRVRYSDHILEKGEAFFKVAVQQQLEGIMGKKASSPYQSRRSSDWVKIKNGQRQEVVIGGFTAPRGSRQKFGALLVGVYNSKKELIYSGHVGGGFNTALLQEIYSKMQPLIQEKSPFKTAPKPNSPVRWVHPKLICEVSFTEWTEDNKMRHPIFHGLRKDKPAKSVKREIPKKSLPSKHSKDSEKGLSLSHLDKIYWPKEKYTKGDLIDYYRIVAPLLLPHLKDRPIVLHRFPNGIEGKDFYQKDISSLKNKWVHTFRVKHGIKVDHYLAIDSVDSLLYAVNLGSIDLHPFLSRYTHLDRPDFCVIDLDPHEVPFSTVIEAALYIHKILEEADAKHYCKTSGGKGLHILIPLQGKYTYEQSRQFAEVIGHLVHEKFPSFTSLERTPAKRKRKLYLDCLQNRTGQTIVAPYSVRPRPGAKVSTPLEWREVNKRLDPTQFTLESLPRRLKAKGDLLKGILKESVDLKKVLSRLSFYTQTT